MVSLSDQIACVKRELAMRERCYPGWVLRKSMTNEKAARELELMQAVLHTLEAVEYEQRKGGG
jgi:hypothetical protein